MMLLRRITEHVKAQNWTAVALDFFIVVVGVFMGLQVQEWSAARSDRANERQALERLVFEYQTNLDTLAQNKTKARNSLSATNDLMSMIAPDPVLDFDEQDLAKTFLDCLTNAKFVPTLGVTNSLVASGDIGLISDPEIQRMLTQWPATAQGMIEWQEIERNHGEELILGLTFDYLAWPTLDGYLDGSGRKSAMTSDYKGLFSSMRFEGLLNNRAYNTQVSIENIQSLEMETQKLIELIEQRLADL